MNNADNDDLGIREAVVDHVIAIEMGSEAWCQLVPLRSQFGGVAQGGPPSIGTPLIESLQAVDGVWAGLSQQTKQAIAATGRFQFGPVTEFAFANKRALAPDAFITANNTVIEAAAAAFDIAEGVGAVAAARKLNGATNPLEADPGSLRGAFALEITENIVHGSDSVDSAKREIGIFFPKQ